MQKNAVLALYESGAPISATCFLNMTKVNANSCHIWGASLIMPHIQRVRKGCMMKSVMILALAAMVSLAACGAPPQTTRAANFLQAEVPTLRQADPYRGKTFLKAQYDVVAINVVVPRTLKVSESNGLRPNADIVWRGDAPGDRYDQVKAIFDAAMARGTAMMHAGRKVTVDIEVTKFHAVTEKARFTIGGTHNMHFLMTLRDAQSGAILQAPRLIVADTHAAGGAKALAEDAAGRTQKVVVIDRLAAVIRRELSAPVQILPEMAAVTRLDSAPLLAAGQP